MSRKTIQEKKPEKRSSKRSEELDGIIDKMPMTFGRWVAIAVLFFAFMSLLFGWIIKYPDTVTGEIKINAQNATVRLVTNAAGNLHLFSHKAQDEIKKGEYIAVIQNPARTEDMRRLSEIISEKDFTEDQLLQLKDTFPDKVSLGEVNLKYYSFLAALKIKVDYRKGNVYEKQKENIQADIEWKKQIIKDSENAQKAAQERMEVARKWLSRYESLNKKEVATYEYEVDQVKSNYLMLVQEVQNIRREISSVRMQIAEAYHQLAQLNIEQKEKELKLQVDILSSFQDLKGNIAAWEQKYALKAPFDGKLEYLKFLSEGKFLQAGEEVFGVIPKEHEIFGQVLLPASGAGKVKKGSKVAIKLDNYPYMEYGYIEGNVSSISLMTQPQKTEKNTIETYLIQVELPNGLKTNYGKHLDFKYEIGGTADIIVKKRRLIERIFDNLRYSVQ